MNFYKKIIIVGIILFLQGCSQNTTYNEEFIAPKDFAILQVTPRDQYINSIISLSDESGKVIDSTDLPRGKGISFGKLRQKGNLIYFDNTYPPANSLIVYDYATHALRDLGEVDLWREGYERINPFSENLFVILNIGYGENGYQTGACYQKNEWYCLENEDKYEYRNGIVWDNKVFVYSANGEPPFDNDKLLVFDKEFNLKEEMNLFEKFSLVHGEINFYSHNDKLFLMGENNKGEFTISEISKDLELINQTSFSEIKYCEPVSLVEEKSGILYIDTICDKAEGGSNVEIVKYQGGNLLFKLDFENLIPEKTHIIRVDHSRLRGINFDNERIFLQGQSESIDKNSISIYDLDFNFKQKFEIERVNEISPMIIDFNKVNFK